MSTLIALPTPPLQYDSDGDYTFRVSVTLPAGRAITDYTLTRMTLREDPTWPSPRGAYSDAPDPIADGWDISATADGTVDDDILVFDITMPSAPGAKRYALDIIGNSVATGFVRLYPTTWVDIKPGITERP